MYATCTARLYLSRCQHANFSDLLGRLSFPHSSLSIKYSSVLLIKPSIAAKRERGERWKNRFVMDDYGRQISSKHGDHRMVLGSCLIGKVCLTSKMIKKAYISYIRAKYASALESTLQPTLVAWHDGLSNLENASVPSLRPAFQSALYHAMKRKKKNNQWELAQTIFNTKVMKWKGEELLDFRTWPEWHMNAVGLSIQWMNAAYQNPIQVPKKSIRLIKCFPLSVTGMSRCP